MEIFDLWYFAIITLFFLGYFLHRHHTITTKIPFSPLFGNLKIGSNYLSNYDLPLSPPPNGEIDDINHFSGPNFDPTILSPSVKHFYEQTSSYSLNYRVFWHFPFRTGAFVASYLTSYIEQLNLPGKNGELHEMKSEFVTIPPSIDPRSGTRAWIRTNSSNETIFVAFYATHKKESTTYVNIAAPLPFSNLSTVLNIKNFESGLELNTLPSTSDGGIYLVTPIGSISLSLSQRFQVLPSTFSPSSNLPPETIIATHEMWVCGLKFLTISYIANKT